MNPKTKNIFIGLFPFILWLFIFQEYFLGIKPAMTSHGLDYYHIIKYLMENYARGVIPMWDPFMFWGRPDNFDARFVGEFNPFHWIYILLSSVGLPRTTSFLIYVTFSYFLGVWGFLLLARKIIQDKILAHITAILVLFSSLSITLFDNFCLTLMFISITWFFYFLVAFLQERTKLHFLGMTFSLMIITTTYLPFYFMIIFTAIMIGYGVCYAKRIPNMVGSVVGFCRKNKILTVFCCAALMISLMPGITWYLSTAEGEYATFRNYQSPDEHSASMNIETINVGGWGGQFSFQKTFSNLHHSRHLHFFLPVFLYLIVLLSIFNKINRRIFAIFLAGFIVYVISLADLTPVHKYLYDHVFVFRLFRNLIFFANLIVPLFALFVIEQFRIFLSKVDESAHKRTWAAYVVVVHAGFFAFLLKMGNVVVTSYLTVLLSAIFLLAYVYGAFKGKKELLAGCLVIIAVLQPVEVLSQYVKNEFGMTYEMIEWFPKEKFEPHFSYTRINRFDDTVTKGDMSDNQHASGFQMDKYRGLKLAKLIHNNISHSILQTYVMHKFVVYDRVQWIAPDELNFERISAALKARENLAFAIKKNKEYLNFSPSQTPNKHYWAPVEDSDNFRIVDFDLNVMSIETNFLDDKFIVFNDTYHSGWRVYINSAPGKVFQANVAFKGVFVPKGESTVEFVFGDVKQKALNWFLILFYISFLALVLREWYIQKVRGESHG